MSLGLHNFRHHSVVVFFGVHWHLSSAGFLVVLLDLVDYVISFLEVKNQESLMSLGVAHLDIQALVSLVDSADGIEGDNCD